MIRNPLTRKRSPLDQALAVLDDVRSEAATAAGRLRDAAADAAELLGEAAPERVSRRLPLIGVGLVAGAAALLFLRASAGPQRSAARSRSVRRRDRRQDDRGAVAGAAARADARRRGRARAAARAEG